MAETTYGTGVRSRLRAAGKTDTELAKAVGKSKTALSRILTDERKDLRRSETDAIEAALLEFEGRGTRPAGLIPMLGYAMAKNSDAIAWALDAPMDWVEPPPMREGSRTQMVAVRIAGDSMEPRLFSGETVYVGLDVAPAKGGDCVLEMSDNSAVIKTYDGRRDGYVHAHQYNPEQALKFQQASIRGVHAVLWRR